MGAFVFGGKSMLNYFSKAEKLLWSGSAVIILVAFFVFDRVNYLNLAA